MKRFALGLLVLALVGCAPSQVAVPVATPDPDQAELVITPGTPDVLRFSAGAAAAYDVRVTVSGEGLRVNAARFCQVDRQSIVCTVPELPKGGNFLLPMTGSNLSAVAVYKRPSGRAYGLETQR